MQAHQEQYARKHRDFERWVEEKRAEYESVCQEVQALKRRDADGAEHLGRQAPPLSPLHDGARSPNGASEPPPSRIRSTNVSDVSSDVNKHEIAGQCSMGKLQ